MILAVLERELTPSDPDHGSEHLPSKLRVLSEHHRRRVIAIRIQHDHIEHVTLHTAADDVRVQPEDLEERSPQQNLPLAGKERYVFDIHSAD